MNHANPLAVTVLWLLTLASVRAAAPSPAASDPLRAVLLSADMATEERMQLARTQEVNSIVLMLTDDDGPDQARQVAAAQRVRAAGLRLGYWIEVARNEALATAHPEWMASLQGHPEWRRLFPQAPEPRESVEVVKVYPWTPMLYKETFDAHLRRIEKHLAALPAADVVLLNDLQGAPSACGCGNTLCRWTTDYGPLKTADPLGPDAAARFLAAVRKLAPSAEVVPVWTTECEEHDGAKDGHCAGVGCFRGICWRAYTEQLMPVTEQAGSLGVLLLYKEFQRDVPFHGAKAGWTAAALRSFQTMPPLHEGRSIPANRLIAVLQGWDVAPDEVKAQIAQARQAGAVAYVVAEARIYQSWTPRVFSLSDGIREKETRIR